MQKGNQYNMYPMSHASKLFKICSNKNQVSIGTLVDKYGKETKPGNDTLRLLFETHFPKHTVKSTPNPPTKEIDTKEKHTSYNNLILLDKVKKALQTFDSKKFPGPDQLNNL